MRQASCCRQHALDVEHLLEPDASVTVGIELAGDVYDELGVHERAAGLREHARAQEVERLDREQRGRAARSEVGLAIGRQSLHPDAHPVPQVRSGRTAPVARREITALRDCRSIAAFARRRPQSGFTLVELLVVIAIIAILIGRPDSGV